MEEMADILEHEMESAFEVKDKNSLKRCANLIARNTVSRSTCEEQTFGIRGEIKALTNEVHFLAKNMREGFDRMDKRFDDLIHQMDKRFESMQHNMDKRFEQVDKRFDDMAGRFKMMFAFITIGFTLLTVITLLVKFVS